MFPFSKIHAMVTEKKSLNHTISKNSRENVLLDGHGLVQLLVSGLGYYISLKFSTVISYIFAS